MLSLWEELLILRAKWEERVDFKEATPEVLVWQKAHDELDTLIKRHTRAKVPSRRCNEAWPSIIGPSSTWTTFRGMRCGYSSCRTTEPST